MSIVTVISIVTIIVSIIGFRKEDLFYKLQLNPFKIIHHKEYHRILTHALLHADWAHLIINMIVFFSFGEGLLNYFKYYFGDIASVVFLLLYIFAVIISSIYSIIKNKNNPNYNAIGASGAVSAVVFASIFFDPWHKIGLYGIIPIPGILFALIYLGYSYYMGKKSYDNIGHDAHLWGAIFGLIFPIILKPELFQIFIHNLIN